MSRANQALSLGFFGREGFKRLGLDRSANSKPQTRLIVAMLSRYPYMRVLIRQRALLL